jgi:hypothetical protein
VPSSQPTHRWRELDSNLRSRRSGSSLESAPSVVCTPSTWVSRRARAHWASRFRGKRAATSSSAKSEPYEAVDGGSKRTDRAANTVSAI